jgi:hypothetical protein
MTTPIPTTSTVTETETATTRDAFPTRKRDKRKTAARIERPFLIFKPLEPRFDEVETGLWILDLTRFLDANRFPIRLKTLQEIR